MKTLKFFSIVLAGALLVLSACKNDNGNEPKFESSIKVTPTELSFTKDGGTQELTLNVSNSWKAEVDAKWCTLSRYEGKKKEFIKVTAKASTSEKETTAVIRFSDTRGASASVTVKREGTGEKPGPTPAGEKCKASDYPQVTIGTQVWMAENYRCSRYDTQSEAYKDGIYIVPTSESYIYTPYYTDASDKSKWNSYSKEHGVNLKDEQIEKLGYLYNWAAAVGVADGQAQITEFTDNRQGICPNGWHIPSRTEWDMLYDYVYKDKSLPSNLVGKYLKTDSGWYNIDSACKLGFDSYGFAALPAGYSYGNEVYNIGSNAIFWFATIVDNYKIWCYILSCYADSTDEITGYKSFGQSVRCVKD